MYNKIKGRRERKKRRKGIIGERKRKKERDTDLTA